MTLYDPAYLALLLCLYAGFEFLLKRLLWKPGAPPRTAPAQGACLLAVMLAGTSGMLSVDLACGCGVIAALLALYDVLTAKMPRMTSRHSLEKFLARQVLAVLLFFCLWRLASPVGVHEWCRAGEDYVLAGLGAVASHVKQRPALVLAITTAYLFVIDGGTRTVRGILDKFPGLFERVVRKHDPVRRGEGDRETGGREEENVGEWIGVLERVITLTFVLTSNFGAIAFAFTAKSIARFKELEDRDFAEYYLLGTSGSILVALAAGMTVKLVFGI